MRAWTGSVRLVIVCAAFAVFMPKVFAFAFNPSPRIRTFDANSEEKPVAGLEFVFNTHKGQSILLLLSRTGNQPIRRAERARDKNSRETKTRKRFTLRFYRFYFQTIRILRANRHCGTNTLGTLYFIYLGIRSTR